MTRLCSSLAAIALLGLAPVAGMAQNAASGEVREIRMTAEKYEFSPHLVTVKKGEHIRLIITALDGEHGIKLEAFHIDQKLPKGEPVTIEFTADEGGTFPFKCSHFCGFGHGKMKGELKVE